MPTLTEYTPLILTGSLTVFVWSGLMGVAALAATVPGICITPFLCHLSGLMVNIALPFAPKFPWASSPVTLRLVPLIPSFLGTF